MTTGSVTPGQARKQQRNSVATTARLHEIAANQKDWWTWGDSNHRPPACKAPDQTPPVFLSLQPITVPINRGICFRSKANPNRLRTTRSCTVRSPSSTPDHKKRQLMRSFQVILGHAQKLQLLRRNVRFR